MGEDQDRETNAQSAVRLNRAYPFTTRASVARRLASEPAFVAEAVLVLDRRREGRASPGSRRPAGWMASEVARGTRLAARVQAGEVSEAELREAGAGWLQRYAHQLAVHARESELQRATPEVLQAAALFGVAPRPAAPSNDAASAGPETVAAARPSGTGSVGAPPAEAPPGEASETPALVLGRKRRMQPPEAPPKPKRRRREGAPEASGPAKPGTKGRRKPGPRTSGGAARGGRKRGGR